MAQYDGSRSGASQFAVSDGMLNHVEAQEVQIVLRIRRLSAGEVESQPELCTCHIGAQQSFPRPIVLIRPQMSTTVMFSAGSWLPRSSPSPVGDQNRSSPFDSVATCPSHAVQNAWLSLWTVLTWSPPLTGRRCAEKLLLRVVTWKSSKSFALGESLGSPSAFVASPARQAGEP